MPQQFGLPSLGGDIDIKIAELSVTGVLRFAQWSQGGGALAPALSCIAELFDAKRCVLTRINPQDMSTELVGVGEATDLAPPVEAVEIFAPRVLGSDLRRVVEGDIRFLSRMSQLTFRLGGGVEDDLASREIADLSFLVLDVGQRGIVLLEFQYRKRPNSSSRHVVEWIAPKLLRAYRPGKGRRIEDEISGLEAQTIDRRHQRTLHCDRAILDVENPKGLTRSEWRVCELASRGLSAKSIAFELGVTGNTVRTHLRNVYAKANVTGYHDLVFTLISQSGVRQPLRVAASS